MPQSERLGDLVLRIGNRPRSNAMRMWIGRGADIGPDTSIDLVQPDEEKLYETQHPEKKPFLLLWIASEVLMVWSDWRSGRKPTEAEAVNALIYYSRNDAYQPVNE